MTDLTSLSTDHKMLSRPIRAKYKHFKTICEQSSDNSPTDSNSSFFELMVVQTRMRNFVKLLHFLVCQFTVSLNALLSMSFHIVRPRYCLYLRFFPPGIFQLHQQKFAIQTFSQIVQHFFICFAFTLSASHIHVVKK